MPDRGHATDLIQFQIDHAVWSIGELLQRSRQLAVEDWRRTFPVGPGSLERTLAHTVEALFFFADGLAGREYLPPADFREAPITVAELDGHCNTGGLALRKAWGHLASAEGTATEVELPVGSGRRMSAAVLLAQTFDHCSHHASQAVWMLKELQGGAAFEVHPLRFAGLDD